MSGHPTADFLSDFCPLFGVASEIPAGLKPTMGEQRPCALLRVGAVVLEVNAAGLLRDRVVVLDGDRVVGL